ncbi:transposase IS1380 family protein [Gloeothece citriformis PCC 7424]|uniref:Transposase IS1380 family protein n=1 Tax=Gloeothece citriformis (strain PCC 7424) TaxID=65393 RepID=B7KJ15_GLOC7|nr:IS1380-like element ISCysp9 family transposase [Gloeothece citriformis]ACK70851.1 transposase IS1380 family protein [Gloeothece citriformis PCC 7424]
MALIPSAKNDEKLNLGKIKGKEVLVNFDGGRITSNGGIVLIAELDKKLKITHRFANCFQDYRNLSYINYSVHQLLAQRIYGIILGYEDINDHDKLRYDPALAIALEKLHIFESNEERLAGKSTINRLEYCPAIILNQEESRYHRIEHQPRDIEKAFIDIFLESYKKPPRQIILDMDVTDDPVHGNQEKAFFNSYYKGVCYAPLYIFCGHHLLVAKLRPSNVDPADGALEELQRIIKMIREKWSNTHILVRGDSAYAREEIMKYCEEQDNIDYVLAMATNSQLQLRAGSEIEKAKNDYEKKLEPVIELIDSLFNKNFDLEEVKELVPDSVWYRSICYKTEKSWSRQRRVVTKVCYGSDGLKIRHIVTSLPACKIPPSKLYTKKYCPRGEMENRIKEQQLDLFADRTSTQTFESNQLRLWLSSIAYVLMQAFRKICLSKTSLSKATVGTIRLNLLKLGARITVTYRRIIIAIANSCPTQHLLAIANSRIQAMGDTG